MFLTVGLHETSALVICKVRCFHQKCNGHWSSLQSCLGHSGHLVEPV